MSAYSDLRAADSYCRHLANQHYENFSVASLALPSQIRRHLMRLYAYCRVTDDLGDESGAEALQRLEVWRQQVEQCLQRGPLPVHPVLLAVRNTVALCNLPAQPFLDLIAANVQDQTVSRYRTWEELRQYCLLSAAPVGRLVLAVWDVRDDHAQRLSDDVCIGLQLANFAQDVRVDRSKGRCYLIASEMIDGNERSGVRRLCDRAESLLDSGRRLEQLVPWRLGVQLALYRLGGTAIVSHIRAMDYQTFRSRPHLSSTTKLRLVAQSLTQSTRRSVHAFPQRAG